MTSRRGERRGGGGGGRGRGRGAYYKAKYGGRGRGGGGRDRGGRGGRGGGDGAPPGPRPPRTGRELLQLLQRIDRSQYGAYKQLRGDFAFESPFQFTLGVDHVQGDAYAAPSRCHIRVPLAVAGLPASAFTTKARSTAAADFLARLFARLVARNGADRRAGGGGWKGAKGGDLTIERPGQQVLERTSVFFTPGFVEVRFCVGLPARGRSIEGVWATQIFSETLPKLAAEALLWSSPELDRAAFAAHVDSVEDQRALRSMLRNAGLVAFVANGAILPRASGASDLPMDASAATPFASPESLLRTFTLPNRGGVSGMGIARGVALIVGGGFHGKSTLLQALEVGVYDHCLGDGRELVVCDASAVKIRAEDGRAVSSLNITPFISHLPFGRSTTRFESADASGSTSQAANILECVATGATTLLLDEDRCVAPPFLLLPRAPLGAPPSRRYVSRRAVAPDTWLPVTPNSQRTRRPAARLTLWRVTTEWSRSLTGPTSQSRRLSSARASSSSATAYRPSSSSAAAASSSMSPTRW